MQRPNLLSGARRPGLKAVLVAFLVMLMSVPLFFIASIANERQDRAEEVRRDVGYEWGGAAQYLGGPFLIVPFDQAYETEVAEQVMVNYRRRHVVIVPEMLSIDADSVTQIRARGIYEVPVFTAQVNVDGTFPAVDLSMYVAAEDRVRWEDAYVAFSLTDARGIRRASPLDLAGGSFGFEPGTRLDVLGQTGAHAPLGRRVDFSRPQPFSYNLAVNGSSRFRVLPTAQETSVTMASDWSSPGFQGAFLPLSPDVSNEGFTANWSVSNLARSFPEQFLAGGHDQPGAASFSAMSFGVDFIVPLDFYQKVFRALRYAIIFIGFSFLAFFLIEIVLKTRLHAVQYLMMGAAQALFYLLLLSASEHIGFTPAYGLAAGATVTLITIYGGAIARSLLAGLSLLIAMGLIYVLLYFLLQVEDYALLFGSIAAFTALAVTMLLTRNINWYGEVAADPAPETT